MTDKPHVPWPTRPDGSNMSLGEMSPEDRKAQIKAAALRFKSKHDKELAPAIRDVLTKNETCND